jgi:hypothetical protein
MSIHVNAYLCLQERQEATANDGLAVTAGAQVMGAVAAGRHLSQVDELSESVIIKTVSGQEILECKVSHCSR